MSAPRKGLIALTLVACILGFLVCPLVYVAVGALFNYPAPISFTLLPFFVPGDSFLLYRYLSKPRDRAGRRLPWLAVEAASWLFVAAFLFFVSGFGLMTDGERFGRACVYFLGSSAALWPVVLVRATTLERRVARMPGAAVIILLLVIVGASAIGMIRYLVTPPHLI